MSEFCDVCFAKVDPFDLCEHMKNDSSAQTAWDDPSATSPNAGSLDLLVVLSPLAGIAADFLLPRWSNPLESLIWTLLFGGIPVVIWIARSYSKTAVRGSAMFRNIPLFLVPPLAIRALAAPAKRVEYSLKWLAILVVSLFVQLAVVTPMNSTALENGIQDFIIDKTGSSLSVDCPSSALIPFGGTLTCEVETGILGITVPANIRVTPILNTISVDVSVN